MGGPRGRTAARWQELPARPLRPRRGRHLIGADDLRRLEARADLIAAELRGVRNVRFALFSGRNLDAGLAGEVEAGRLLHFSAADLFA